MLIRGQCSMGTALRLQLARPHASSSHQITNGISYATIYIMVSIMKGACNAGTCVYCSGTIHRAVTSKVDDLGRWIKKSESRWLRRYYMHALYKAQLSGSWQCTGERGASDSSLATTWSTRKSRRQNFVGWEVIAGGTCLTYQIQHWGYVLCKNRMAQAVVECLQTDSRSCRAQPR